VRCGRRAGIRGQASTRHDSFGGREAAYLNMNVRYSADPAFYTNVWPLRAWRSLGTAQVTQCAMRHHGMVIVLSEVRYFKLTFRLVQKRKRQGPSSKIADHHT